MDKLVSNLERSKKGQCFYCERHFVEANYGTNKPLAATRDHIIPLSKGGRGDGLNVVRCCIECNQLKANLLPEDFLEKVITIIINNKKYKTITESRLYIIKKNVSRLIEEIVKPNGPILYKHITINDSVNFNLKMSINGCTRQEIKFLSTKELLGLKSFAEGVLNKSFIEKFLAKYKDTPPRNFHYAERRIHR